MEGSRRDSGFNKVGCLANDNISNDEPGDDSPIAAVAATAARLCAQQQQRRLAAGEQEALRQRLSPANAGGEPPQPPEDDAQPTEVNNQNTLVRKLANANSRWEQYCRKQAEEHATYARSLDQRVNELERLLSDSRAAEQRLRDAVERQRADALRDQLAAEELHAVLLAQLASTGADPWTPTTAAADEKEDEERADACRSATASSQQDSRQQHEEQTSEEATARGTDTSEPARSEGDGVVEIAQPPPAAVEAATSAAIGLCDDQLTPLLRLQIMTLEEDFAHERRDKESERQKGVAARQRCDELVRENSLLRQKLSAAEVDLDRIRKERRQLRKTVEQLRQATGAAAPAAFPGGPSRRPCAIAAAPQSHAAAGAADWWMKLSPASKVPAAGCCGVMSACTTGGSGCGLHCCIVFGRPATHSASATADECGAWVVRCR